MNVLRNLKLGKSCGYRRCQGIMQRVIRNPILPTAEPELLRPGTA